MITASCSFLIFNSGFYEFSFSTWTEKDIQVLNTYG